MPSKRFPIFVPLDIKRLFSGRFSLPSVTSCKKIPDQPDQPAEPDRAAARGDHVAVNRHDQRIGAQRPLGQLPVDPPVEFRVFLAGCYCMRPHAKQIARRPILIAADAGRALALATIPAAALFDLLTIEQLCAVALITSALSVFFNAAYEAYLPTLVSRDELVEGNSKLTATASVAEYGAFSASGWLVQLFSGPGAVLVDAVSFVVSAFSIWRIRTPEPAAAPVDERQHLLREVQEGLRMVVHDSVLRTMAVTNVLLDFSRPLVGVTFLLYLTREVGFDPGVLGMIFAIGGLTSLAGAAVAGRWSWFGGLGPALVISLFIRGVGGLFMPLTTNAAAAGISCQVRAQVVTDPAWTFYEINTVSVRQAIAPERLRGRIGASMHFLSFGSQLLGTGAAGVLAETIGLQETLFVSAGCTFAAALWLLVSPVRKLRHMPEPIAA